MVRRRKNRGAGITSSLIARAEKEVGKALTRELQPYFRIARELTDIAGDVVEHVQTAPGVPTALHVCAILLARLINDLQACVILVKSGYVTQSLSLTAGMLEIAHTSMYVGTDETRAERWVGHADDASTPWSVYDMVQEVARDVGADQAASKREYEQIYRQANMAKHGNPMAFSEVGVHVTGDSVFLLSSPYLSLPVRRWAHVSIQLAIRYTKFATLRFISDHMRSEPRLPALVAELTRLTEELKPLMSADFAEFGGADSEKTP